MITKLTEANRKQLMEFVCKKPAENLFIIGDVEAFGFNNEFQTVWGQFDATGELIAVLLKYETNYIPYATGEYDIEGFAEIINNDPNMGEISGLKEVVEKLEPLIPKRKRSNNSFYYAKCQSLLETKSDEELKKVEELTLAEIQENVDLLKSVPEFQSSNITVESKKRVIENKTGRTYFIRVDGEMATTASTTAENSSSAMIIAVATKEKFKRQGLATDCMIKLCKDLLNEGKELCLFYDNPEAGKIYKRLGFEDIGFWNMYRYE
ncbi:GNAT family N-acetyltransferase [Ureibacillus sinduriensis]|uniref:GNAT family acetyltraansferase n=1 Tax=Ureibacillus sinduriensis BLB-1 = JCM 15800 TaxID=1384057 RepID=A0A0A3HPI4_9BACL|nr:GNAT family N-acetyltransferase [Ureibacillus sinduriensis]KGR74481.1 GNAT family acetyltraansferase [Ureibacillus sinduriensis BLB-1 = JCM 15800]